MTHRQSIYESIGGIDKVDELVDRFYDLMSLEPLFAIRLHFWRRQFRQWQLFRSRDAVQDLFHEVV